VIVHKTRGIYIRRRRVPLAEVYCLIFENFHIAYTNGTGVSSLKASSACSEVQVDGVAVISSLISQRVGWVSSQTAEAPCFQRRGFEVISVLRRNGRGPDSSLKRVWVFV
jgi:hypothetical protein